MLMKKRMTTICFEVEEDQLLAIFEEITEYIELTAKGNCKCMKWENINSLLNSAVLNNRITK